MSGREQNGSEKHDEGETEPVEECYDANSLTDLLNSTLLANANYVSCSNQKLDFSGFSNLPTGLLLKLTDLTYWKMSNTQVLLEIPSDFEKLTKITHLDVSGNYYPYFIDASFSELTNLEYLNVGSSESTFPDVFNSRISKLTNLETLEAECSFGVSFCSNGLFKVPTGILDLEKLTEVNIAGRALIPLDSGLTFSTSLRKLKAGAPSFGNYTEYLEPFYKLTTLTHLEIIALSIFANGVMVTELAMLSNLEKMVTNVYKDADVGSIIGALTKLTHLNLEGSFQGTFPTQLGQLTALKHLQMHRPSYENGFQGFLPKQLGYLSELTYLDIGGVGNLNGNMPKELNLLKSLEHLDVAYLGLTDTLPIEFSEFSKLTHLNVEYNRFYGEISSDIGSLQNLEFLNLQSNCFNGAFPKEIKNLKNISTLKVNKNSFSGTMPYFRALDFDISPGDSFESTKTGCGLEPGLSSVALYLLVFGSLLLVSGAISLVRYIYKPTVKNEQPVKNLTGETVVEAKEKNAM